MKIEINSDQLSISQDANIKNVLHKFSMEECNTVKTPMDKGLQLRQSNGNSIDKPYKELLGSLMYIMLCVRPDICYHVGYLGRLQQHATEEHWVALKRILCFDE